MGAELPDLSEGEFRGRLAEAYAGELSPGAAARLYAHYRELRRWNRRVALVGRGVVGTIIERLYGESLAALSLIDGTVRRVLDVGSGAGFPGLVIAAARPALRVTLVEPRQRKWAFLRSAAARAALSCECLNARVSAALPSGIPESLDRITVRALRLGASERGALSARLAPGGSFLLWTGPGGGTPTGFHVKGAVDLGVGRGRILDATAANSPQR